MRKILLPYLFILLFAFPCLESFAQTQSSDTANMVIETIMSRRSIRKYRPQPVALQQMETIMKCGIHAPNGMNAQNWVFRVVDNADFINGITKLFVANGGERMAKDPDFKNMFRNAPTVVFVATKNGESLIDAGLAVENMILAAWSMGIGSCCLGGPVGFINQPVSQEYMKQLNLPEGYKVVLAVGFGYPDEKPDAKPRDGGKVQYIH